eukprot:766362-Hanusia_phi.AAC.1
MPVTHFRLAPYCRSSHRPFQSPHPVLRISSAQRYATSPPPVLRAWVHGNARITGAYRVGRCR